MPSLSSSIIGHGNITHVAKFAQNVLIHAKKIDQSVRQFTSIMYRLGVCPELDSYVIISDIINAIYIKALLKLALSLFVIIQWREMRIFLASLHTHLNK